MEEPLIQMNEVKMESPADTTAPAVAPAEKKKEKKKQDKATKAAAAAAADSNIDASNEKAAKEDKSEGEKSSGKQKKPKDDESVKEKQEKSAKKKKGADKSGEGKKNKESEKKEEVAGNVLKDLLVPLIQPASVNNADVAPVEPPGLGKERESPPSEGEVKKSNKKSKKNKNKKNHQAAENNKAQADEQQPQSPASVSENKNQSKKEANESKRQAENKKEQGESHSKKKGEKKEAKKDAGIVVGGTSDNAAIMSRLVKLEDENRHLRNLVDDVKNMVEFFNKLVVRVDCLEKALKAGAFVSGGTGGGDENKSAAQLKKEEKADDDDDVDLFGSDEEEDAEMEKVKAERLRMYEEKKQKKPALVAKSNIILDVKPWDDETDMKEMEKSVRAISCDGLLWGASKLVPLAYGIHKLQISSVIEDEKVSVDWLQEEIEAITDLVQSVDIAAFNKV